MDIHVSGAVLDCNEPDALVCVFSGLAVEEGEDGQGGTREEVKGGGG